MKGTTAYALSRKYTQDTADALGAVKGAPCEIQSIVYDEETGTTTITFSWTGTSGQVQTDTAVIHDGTQVEVEQKLSSGTLIGIITVDGVDVPLYVPQGGELTQSLTATTVIGSVTNGKTYPVGTSIETIIRDILISYAAPTVSLTTNPSTRLYDIVTDSVATILLKAAVTKKTNDVTKVAFYVGNTLVNEITTGVASGGNFSYQYTPGTAITSDTTFKATATDGKQTTTSSVTIKFVGKSYYGICDASVSDPSATVIKSGTGNLKDTRNLVYSGITTDWGKVFYAYPKSFGALTYIKDEINNINYFDSFQRSEVTVDGIAYYCYTLIEPTAASDNQITFK